MVAKTIIVQYVKEMHKKYKLTQVDLSEKAGVGLRFVRELEQGKTTLRLDKVNKVIRTLRFRVWSCANETGGKLIMVI